MNVLAVIAAKLIFKKVAKEFATQVDSNPNVPTIKAGEAVYIKEVDSKKVWVSVVITALTVASSMGWIPEPISSAFIELISNEAVQEGAESVVESLTD